MPSLRSPIIGLVISGFMTFGLFMTAMQIADGTHVDYAGRHAARNRLLAEVAGALGPIGCLALGLPFVLLSVLWLVLRIRKRRRLACLVGTGGE